MRIGTFDAEEAARLLATALEGSTGVAVLVDGTVGERSPRVAPLVSALARRLPRVERHDLPGGERAKSLSAVENTAEWLASRGYDRGAAIIGIGGGAAGDHAGFVAAIYLRGIRFALCPTTLLAMVDASVGGKTAVDLQAGKNLVGAFHQPRAVVADLGFLDTLPIREQRAGMAEVVKCGFIADAQLLDRLEREAPRLTGAEAGETTWDRAVIAELIAAAVRVKAEVVTEDERETGRRAILNFGHTVGHALEAASNYELLHGEAVALGMVAALSLGTSMGVTPPALRDRGRRLIEALDLPVDVERRMTPEALSRMDVDKKRRSDAVRFVFCVAPGDTRIQEVPLAEARSRLLGLRM